VTEEEENEEELGPVVDGEEHKEPPPPPKRRGRPPGKTKKPVVELVEKPDRATEMREETPEPEPEPEPEVEEKPEEDGDLRFEDQTFMVQAPLADPEAGEMNSVIFTSNYDDLIETMKKAKAIDGVDVNAVRIFIIGPEVKVNGYRLNLELL